MLKLLALKRVLCSWGARVSLLGFGALRLREEKNIEFTAKQTNFDRIECEVVMHWLHIFFIYHTQPQGTRYMFAIYFTCVAHLFCTLPLLLYSLYLRFQLNQIQSIFLLFFFESTDSLINSVNGCIMGPDQANIINTDKQNLQLVDVCWRCKMNWSLSSDRRDGEMAKHL